MNEPFEPVNESGTYQTGRTAPRKRHTGLIAFLIGLVILLSGISTALSILNLKLYRQLTVQETQAPVVFSHSADGTPMPTEADHSQLQPLQSHLGISGTVIPVVFQRYYKLPQGIYVSRVASGSEAQKKGIVVGDIITLLDGVALAEEPDQWFQELEEGDTVQLTLYRSGSPLEITLHWSQIS